MIRRLAFWSAIFAYALLLVVVVIAPLGYPDYSPVRQYIAELGAKGAPHGVLVSLGGYVPVGLALMVFAACSAVDHPRSKARWAAFGCMFVFGASFVVGGIFPCDVGCPLNSGTIFQQIHSAFGVASYAAGATGLMLLGVAAGRWRGGAWLSPLAITAGLLSVGCFFFMDGPWRGLAQRIIESAIGIWILTYVITLRLLPPTETSPSAQEQAGVR